MSEGSGDIIIKGGSVEIVFNEAVFPGQDGRYSNQQNKIVSVDVKDDNTDEMQTINIPANGKCTIRIHTR